jgi:hypothetical protein
LEGETIVQKGCEQCIYLKAHDVGNQEEENGESDGQAQIKQLVRGRLTIARDQQKEAARKRLIE